MAFRPILSRHAALPAAAGLVATSTLLIPRGTLYAEEPPHDLNAQRKPIYDDYPASPKQPTLTVPPTSSDDDNTTKSSSSSSSSIPSFLGGGSSSSSSSTETPTRTSPSPTDRLATQIGRARSFLQVHAALAEDKFNATMTRALSLEDSFTSTIASLAPAPETRERVLPGALYVLVAGMAGSIVARNRNIVLRATAPLVVGVGASWVVLPHTTRNVADLVWKYEERYPVVSMNHMRIRGAVEQGWRDAKVRGKATQEWADERVKGGREVVEGWVRKGR